MAKSGLTISVVLELIKSGFDKSAKAVESSVNRLKASFVRWFAVISGGALALTTLVRSLKQTALAVERNRIALKNVTEGVVDFNRAQKFLDVTARTYGQDLLALTQGYVGFSAAARQANVPIEDQEKIFEAVTKACATYGLSTERTGLVTLALSQMMSKGKISSEELRRQMGEHLPIAYMAMARASGLTTAQFEKMMAKGAILSKDILPKFADELDKVTASADFDNFVTSWTKLKNEFAIGIKSLDLPGRIKPMIDGLVALVRGAVNNMRALIGGLIAFIISKPLKRLRTASIATAQGVKTQYMHAAQEIKAIDEQLAASKGTMQERSTAIHSKYAKTIEKIERDKTTRLMLLDKKLETLKASAEANKQRIVTATAQKEIALKAKNAQKVAQLDATIARNKEQLARREAQINKIVAEDKVRVTERSSAAVLKAEQAKTKGLEAIATEELTQRKLVERQKVLETEKANAAAVLSTSRSSQLMKATWATLGRAMKSMWVSIQSLISMSIFGAIATAIGSLIGWITDVISKAREATRVAKEVKAAIALSDEDRAESAKKNKDLDAKLLDDNIATLASLTATNKDKQLAAESIKQSTGITGDYEVKDGKFYDGGILVKAKQYSDLLQQQRIVQSLEEDVVNAQEQEDSLLGQGYLKKNAKAKGVDVETYVREYMSETNDGSLMSKVTGSATQGKGAIIDAIDARKKLEAKYNEAKRKEAELKAIVDGEGAQGTIGDYGGTVEGAEKAYLEKLERFEKKRSVLEEKVYSDEKYKKDKSDASKDFLEEIVLAQAEKAKDNPLYQEALSRVIPDKAKGAGASKMEKTTAEQVVEAEKQYAEGLRTAKNQLDAGVKTKKQYDEEVLRLSQRHADTLGGLLGAGAKQIDSYNKANEVIIEASDEFKKLKESFSKDADVLNKKLADGELTEDEYASALTQLVEEYVERMYTSLDVGDAERDYKDLLRMRTKLLRENAYDSPFNIGNADLTNADKDAIAGVGDTSSSAKDIKANLDVLKKRQSDVEAVIRKIMEELRSDGWKASDLAIIDKALEDGELSEEEVKKLFEVFGDRIVKDLQKYAQGADTLKKAVAVGEANYTYKDEREKATSGVYKNIKGLASSTSRLTRSFKSLKEAFESPDTSGWEKMVTLFNSLTQAIETFIAIGKGIKAVASCIDTLSKSTETASAISAAAGATEVATSEAVTGAKVTETVAKTTSAYASIPFIGVALAGAAIGAMLALIVSNAGKFATGGIVGGNSYSGDKVMAMVNSGEMILNQSQQARLFKMANSGEIGRNVQQTVVVGGTLTAKADKLSMVLRKEAIRKSRL